MTEPKEETVQFDDAVHHRRMVEAILFASEHPVSAEDIAERLPDGADVAGHLASLSQEYETRGVTLSVVAGKYMFITAPDLSFLLRREVDDQRKLSRAAVETLAIIAYHQPVTRAEIEEIRGVGISKGTLDLLMEASWVRIMGRRKTPGRPVTYGTSEDFLVHFGLESIQDLPGLSELKAAGLLETVDQALDKMSRGAKLPLEGDDEEDQIDLEDAIDEHRSQEEADDEEMDEDDEYEDWGEDDEEEL